MFYDNEYFCPKCGATLNEQPGFDPNGDWTCTECGQHLMDEDTYNGDRFEGVAWHCDSCNALLNKQIGFSDFYDTWTCENCGHENPINEDEINDDYSSSSSHSYEENDVYHSWLCNDIIIMQAGFSFRTWHDI